MDNQEVTEFDKDLAALEEITVQIAWLSRRRLEHELDAFQLTVPQYITLCCIEESQQGCRMSDLAESSYQVTPTMTGIVDRLVERGLVRRERDESDRRSLLVRLTPAGVELLEQVKATKREWIRLFMAELPVEERQVMIRMAQRYLDGVRSSFVAL